MEKAKTESISYMELSKRVGDMVMMNNIPQVDEELYDNLENGDLFGTDEETGEQYEDAKDIYQFFAISNGGAEYLKRYTDELMFYSKKLDCYFWGITHFGTGWDGVFTQIYTEPKE